ncbi:MAG: acetate--CoA ligase family protein [Hyphomicrobiales bacterium]
MPQLLRPRTIAIVGASAAAHKAGGRRWLGAIAESRHPKLFAITLSGGTLSGHETYGSLGQIPQVVDLAVVMVPGGAVREVVGECAALGIKAVVVISAGFAETGPEGLAVEAELAATMRRSGGRLLGPNSAGIYSAEGGVNLLGWKVPKGPIGLVTQSGNVALTFTHLARAKQSGFSAILAPGNGADLRISELVSMLLDEEATRSILIYCEGFAEGDGRRLVEVMRETRTKKPIVILKAGASEAGSKAAQSHTGSLAGDDRLTDGILGSAGIIRALETEEAFDLALALASSKAPLGLDIAILSDGGGHATIVADCAGRHGLRLSCFAPDTVSRMRSLLPARSGVENPVDFAGLAESEPTSVAQAIGLCLADPHVRGVVFAGHFGGYHLMTDDEPTQARVAQLEKEAAEQIAVAANASAKPLVMHSEHAERGLPTLEPLYKAGIPIYAGLESAAKAMAVLAVRSGAADGWEIRRARPASGSTAGQDQGIRQVPDPEARGRLIRAGIALPHCRTVTTSAEALAAFAEPGQPVAMKLISAKVIHKSDIGGVILDISSADSSEAAFARLMSIARDIGAEDARISMTPMISAGIECLIGGAIDAKFGPAISFGAGGVLVELIEDVAFDLAPIDQLQARKMIAGTRVSRLLQGYRGRAPADLPALIALLTAASRFLAESPSVVGLDLNPVIVNETGAHVVDVRVLERE